MAIMTPEESRLLAELAKAGGGIFNSTLDGGGLRIGARIYTPQGQPRTLAAFQSLKKRRYILSDDGVLFQLTASGERRVNAAR